MKTGKYKDTDSHMLSDYLQKLKNKPKLLLKFGLIFVSVDLSLKREKKKDTERLQYQNPSMNPAYHQSFLTPFLGTALWVDMR